LSEAERKRRNQIANQKRKEKVKAEKERMLAEQKKNEDILKKFELQLKVNAEMEKKLAAMEAWKQAQELNIL
jgi:hypothetical protein